MSDTVTIPKDDFLALVRHVSHDVLCMVFDEGYIGDECCRHGQCADAEGSDEIHGTWAGTSKGHPALTDAVKEAYKEALG